MNEASSILSAWANFYVITGSSAAALTGLMFVVVTLSAGGDRPASSPVGFSTFSTPTVIHFCCAFLISAVASAPVHAPIQPAAIFAVIGLFGLAYISRITYLVTKQTVYQPDLEDWAWFCILPLLTYLVTTGSAVLLDAGNVSATYGLAGATLLLILIGIHNAWDVVTYIAITLPAQEREEADASTQDDNQRR